MRIPNDHNDQPPGPQTLEEAEFLEAYRELDAAGRVLVWCALLERKGRRPERRRSTERATVTRR